MKRFTILVLLLVMAIGVFAVPAAAQNIETVCLITDIGRINDGTFNQYAYEGMISAVDDFDLESTFIETQSEVDYAANINTCVEEGFDIIVTVGFLLKDATAEAAAANPDIYFLGVDEFVSEEDPENFAGILFREDQSGFMAGALAAKVAELNDSSIVAGIYGVDIPPVVKFRNGFEQGVAYINPDIETLGVYIPDFQAPDQGASAAEQFIGEGASVIFGAGGPTGSGGIQAAAGQDVYVIGVDQDEYLTTFSDGETPGSEFLISSAVKRVDQGVYDMIQALVEGDMDAFPGAGNYIMGAAENGIGLADKHDADIPDEIYEELEEVFDGLASGDIETGVDPISGELMSEDDMMDDEDMEEDMDDEDMEEDMEPEATEESDS